jgi:DNA-binding LacI/PurR family transcriptional regulator
MSGRDSSKRGSAASTASQTRPAGRRSVTMKDVARAAGVSQSTVSRILNDAPIPIPVSDATRRRVRALADELGYRPHPVARALRGAPTMLLGAIVRDVTDLFFATAVEALSTEARSRGYSLVLGHAARRADEALALTAVLEARQCDGVILLGDLTDEPVLIDDLRDAPLPTVAVWHGSQLDGFRTVCVDNDAGIDAALEHLHALGHRHIAFVGGESLGDIRERQAAFERHHRKLGMRVPRRYVQHVDNTLQGGYAAFEALFAAGSPPTAIVAATDVLAIGILFAAHARGVAVPEALSLVGFDDIPLAAATSPGLTTVRMPVAAMAAAAIDIATRVAPDDGGPPIFPPELIVRRSTGPAPDAA